MRQWQTERSPRRGEREVGVQFQQELFVPFQTGVTWQALTNNQWHQNTAIKPRLISRHTQGALQVVTLKWHRQEDNWWFGESMRVQCVNECVLVTSCRQTTPPILSLSLSLSGVEWWQGPPTTRSKRDLIPYQMDQTAACQRTSGTERRTDERWKKMDKLKACNGQGHVTMEIFQQYSSMTLKVAVVTVWHTSRSLVQRVKARVDRRQKRRERMTDGKRTWSLQRQQWWK